MTNPSRHLTALLFALCGIGEQVATLVTNSDNQSAILGAARYLGTRWYILGQTQYQHNLGLNLEHRATTLGSIARRLVQTNRTLLTAGAGAAYAREKYYGSPSTNEAEGVAGSRFQYFKLFSPELISDFYWNLTFLKATIPNRRTLSR